MSQMAPAPSKADQAQNEVREEANGSKSNPDSIPLEPPINAEVEKINKKKATLSQRIDDLEVKIQETQRQLDESKSKLGNIDAAARVQRHIKLLHQYNEIKDIGIGLFGLIADRRGVQVRDIFEEFGMAMD